MIFLVSSAKINHDNIVLSQLFIQTKRVVG
jgi:hypothetical protein